MTSSLRPGATLSDSMSVTKPYLYSSLVTCCKDVLMANSPSCTTQ